MEKTVENNSNTGKIVTGARITDPFSREAEEFANMYYAEIRSFSTDTIRIAENLDVEESSIRRIKEYLFEEKTLYDEETGEWRRFDPDCAIAQSWQRLMTGKDIKQHDITLIKHELLEIEIKASAPGISHMEAHIKASKTYDYDKEATEYYDSLKKH